MSVLDPPTPGSLAETFWETQRQMIYVHRLHRFAFKRHNFE